MDIKKLLSAIECVKHSVHECPKQDNALERCAFCELGFLFIAKDPIQLGCGHNICEKCAFNDDMKQIFCKSHGDTNSVAEAHTSKLLINNYTEELFVMLKSQSESALLLYKDTKNNLNKRVETSLSSVKTLIDKKVDELINELNDIRKTLYQQAEKYSKDFIENYDYENKIVKDYENLKNYIEKNNVHKMSDFYVYQDSLFKSVQDIQKCLKTSINLIFTESNHSLNAFQNVGTIKVDITNIKSELKNEVPEENTDKKLIKEDEFKESTDNSSTTSSSTNTCDFETYTNENVQIKCRIPLWHTDVIRDIKYIGYGLLAACSNEKINVWNLETNSILNKIKFDASQLLILRNKNIIAAGYQSNKVLIWNHNSSKSNEKKTSGIMKCIEQLDDDLLVFGEAVSTTTDSSTKAYLTFWSVDQTHLKYLESIRNAHTDEITCIKALSNNCFASGSKDKKINIWTKKEKKYHYQHALNGHSDAIICLNLLPDQTLISSSLDRSLRIWKYENKECLKVIENLNAFWQLLRHENLIFAKLGVKSSGIGVVNVEHDDKLTPLSIQHIHRKGEIDLLEFVEGNYLASTNNCEIMLYDFENELNYFKNKNIKENKCFNENTSPKKRKYV